MSNYKKFGIDISHWQGNYSLNLAVDEGVEFVVIKGGGGDDAGGCYVDSKFVANYTYAKALELPVGIYWFTDARSVASALAEADYFYENCLRNRQFELPVYLDVEGDMGDLSYSELTEIVKAWCERIENYGYYVGIYSNGWWFDSKMDGSQLPYTRWYAAWVTDKPDGCDMWQFGGETNLLRPAKVAGVVTDQDYMYKDFTSIIKDAGLNGFTKEEDSPMTAEEKKAFNSLKSEVDKLKKTINAHTTPKYGYVDGNMPSWARDDITYLIRKGFLTGDEKGNLQLSNDMLREMCVFSRGLQEAEKKGK